MISDTLLRSVSGKYYEFYVKHPLVLYTHIKEINTVNANFIFMHF